MLDEPVPVEPGAYQGSVSSVSVPGLLHLEDVRSLLRYKAYFRTEAVGSADLLRMAFSLRYQVYCLERNFEPTEHHPARMETDQYDPQSVHGLLFYRPWNKPIGTTRLILPNRDAKPLPVQALLGKSGARLPVHYPWAATAEVSRFAVSRLFRPDKSEHSALPCLGLAQMLLRLSLAHDITHWIALMSPALLRMLARLGIEFTPLGPLVSCHGLRQPCGCNLLQLLETLSRRNRANWQIMTDGGALLKG